VRSHICLITPHWHGHPQLCLQCGCRTAKQSMKDECQSCRRLSLSCPQLSISARSGRFLAAFSTPPLEKHFDRAGHRRKALCRKTGGSSFCKWRNKQGPSRRQGTKRCRTRAAGRAAATNPAGVGVRSGWKVCQLPLAAVRMSFSLRIIVVGKPRSVSAQQQLPQQPIRSGRQPEAANKS